MDAFTQADPISQFIRDDEPPANWSHLVLLRLARLLDTSTAIRVHTLLMRLTAWDRPTAEHSQRVASLGVQLGQALGLPSAYVTEIELAALFHDVGKLAIPEAVLDKRGPLDERERGLLRCHPRVGYEVMKVFPALARAADLVLASHEAYDGSGYPRGLKAWEIPLGSRIVSVADTYDALTNRRSYRGPAAAADALSELSSCSGKQFDPLVVETLGRLLADQSPPTFH